MTRSAQADGEGAAHADAPSHAPLTIVGERKGKPSDCLILAHDAYHPRSERIRMLRTELLLRQDAGDSANTFAVLSPCPGEGRSQIAAELGVAFAQLGQPTLLVDADLRNPRQHALFGVDNARGLSTALARRQPPQYHAIAGLPALSLLTAGPAPHNPLELLSDQRFEDLVGEWQRSFQFIVLDTPPVRDYADGLAVATIVGRILSLSRARHTRYSDSREMIRRLAATRSQILGAVINHF